MIYFAPVIYKYLYQDKDNRNCEGEIKAKNRNDAYLALRKMGIRPYRVIGDDPVNWIPWAVWLGYGLLLAVIAALLLHIAEKTSSRHSKYTAEIGFPSGVPSDVHKELLRGKAELSVYRAPPQFRRDVWKSVNEHLESMGIEKIEYPEGLEGFNDDPASPAGGR